MILVDWFFATRIRIRFIEADPDPADQTETDPKGSETLYYTIIQIWSKY